MELLPTNFKSVDGFIHEQMIRDDKYAVYKRYKKGQSTFHYEVIIIKKKHGKEYYPEAEHWGSQGWTVIDYPSALSSLKNLQNTEEIEEVFLTSP